MDRIPAALRERKQVKPGWVYALKDRLAYDAVGGVAISEAANDGKMYIPAIISTISRDRCGDEVVPEGCHSYPFRNNPVVFFSHQQVPIPVGLAESPPHSGNLDLSITPGQNIRSGCYFHQSSSEGPQFYQLVKDGIIRATSIGFNPLSEPIRLGTMEGNLYAGFRYEEWELLEWSWCAIGMNAECSSLLRSYLSAGKIAGEKIGELVYKALEPLAEPVKVWSPGATLKTKEAIMSERKDPPVDVDPEVKGIILSRVKDLPAGTVKKLLAMIPQKKKDALQDCVSRKIPKLLDEGYPQDQAEAIAYSMCGEKGMDDGSGTDGGYETKPDGDGEEEDKAEVLGDAESEAEEESKEVLPDAMSEAEEETKSDCPECGMEPCVCPKKGKKGRKAKALHKLTGVLLELKKALEPSADTDTEEEEAEAKEREAPAASPAADDGDGGDLAQVLAGLVALICELQYMIQPPAPEPVAADDDFDLDGEDDMDDEKPPAEEDEEILQRYRRGKGKITKDRKGKVLIPLEKSMRFTKRHKMVCEASAMCHKEMSEMEPGTPISHMHKAAHAHHAKELSGLIKSMEAQTPEEGEQQGDLSEVESKAIMEALMQLDNQLTVSGNSLYKLTGKRA